MTDSPSLQVPIAVFDGSQFAPHERFERFGQVTPGYDVLLPPGTRAEDLEITSRAWLLDDLALTANVCSGIEFRRTAAHIKDYTRDTYTLILLLDGQWQAELDYGDIQVGSGEVCFIDFTVPWHVRGARQSNVMLVVPKALIDDAVPDAPRLHGRRLEGSSGRLFAEHLLSLARHLPDLMQRDVPLVRDATMSLLGNAVAALPKEEARRPISSSRALSIGRVRTFIDENLTNPDLTATLICHELAVTRPTLYRAFHAMGGVAVYIQRRRLEAAHARISAGGSTLSMAEIADTFCFSSPAHFSTAFRRQFGFTPRDARIPSAQIDAIELFRIWLDGVGDGARQPSRCGLEPIARRNSAPRRSCRPSA